MTTDEITQQELPRPESIEGRLRVVYLVGTGASHASAIALGSSRGLLMRDLTLEIAEAVRRQVESNHNPSITTLANEVVQDDTDIEHIITFLDESGSDAHRQFAADLRKVFEEVLRSRIDAITTDLDTTPTVLYAALVDMHRVAGSREILQGILTLNYDEFLEAAITDSLGLAVDYGIHVTDGMSEGEKVRVLKLHGSFGWKHVWPIQPRARAEDPKLWIPPGIQKAKSGYPFNALWGMARELLDCDVVRIVGCNLGANDWDLVSMLFAAQHTHADLKTFAVEIIDLPEAAERIKSRFPYLRAKSLLELDQIGEDIISESSLGLVGRFAELPEQEREALVQYASTNIANPFLYWLQQKAEAMQRELGSVETATNAFSRVLEL